MTKRPLTCLLPLSVALMLTVGACGGGEAPEPIQSGEPTPEVTATPPTEENTDLTATPAITVPDAGPSTEEDTDLTAKPVISVPDTGPPTVLEVNDLVVGTGAIAQSGAFLIMHYVGVSYSSGLQFDASWDRGQPLTFVLGDGRVIKGWDNGILGMAAGGRRELVIPPDQGYGERGSSSGSIGPNETLIFVVDLVGIVPASMTKPDVAVPAEPATTLAVIDIIEGDGAAAAEGAVLWVHYVGAAQSTGEQFDASWDRGIDQPFTFTLGAGQVIQGWERGLEGMKVGGRREIIIPSDLGYGERGAGGGLIAPNETLVFVVDLVAIN